MQPENDQSSTVQKSLSLKQDVIENVTAKKDKLEVIKSVQVIFLKITIVSVLLLGAGVFLALSTCSDQTNDYSCFSPVAAIMGIAPLAAVPLIASLFLGLVRFSMIFWRHLSEHRK